MRNLNKMMIVLNKNRCQDDKEVMFIKNSKKNIKNIKDINEIRQGSTICLGIWYPGYQKFLRGVPAA